MDKVYEKIKIIPKIKSICIEKEGIIKNSDIEFKEGLNLIIRDCATGKTTIMKAIEKGLKSKLDNIFVDAIDDRKPQSMNEFVNNSSIGGRTMFGLLGLVHAKIPNSCFLMDDCLDRMSNDDIKFILEKLSLSENQFVITLRNPITIPNANIIETKNLQ